MFTAFMFARNLSLKINTIKKKTITFFSRKRKANYYSRVPLLGEGGKSKVFKSSKF